MLEMFCRFGNISTAKQSLFVTFHATKVNTVGSALWSTEAGILHQPQQLVFIKLYYYIKNVMNGKENSQRNANAVDSAIKWNLQWVHHLLTDVLFEFSPRAIQCHTTFSCCIDDLPNMT